MGSSFWPVFVTVAAVSAAAVWKFSPEIGQHLPAPVRDTLHGLVRGGGGADTQPAPAPAAVSADVGTAADALAATNANVQTAVRTAPAAQPPPAALPQPPPGGVTPTDRNPTGSPYLEPAAKALRQYRHLLADFERKQQGMNIATQRAAMKKLHEANARLEYLNKRHREWKQSHPAVKNGAGR